jgi:nucleoside-diphosphate-sugar epimerase
MSENIALVIGATGLVGGHLASHIAGLDGWRALGVSRSRPEMKASAYEHLSFDLLDAKQCADALAAHPGITHLYVAARTKGATADAEERNNVALLANLLDALDTHAPRLRHVHLVHGTKWYGAHLPSTRPPFREDDHRVMPPNPYYAPHDYLVERHHQADKRWSWSTSRPALIFGFSHGYPHNIVGLIGVYAALCKELGTQFRFPGTDWCYRSLQSATDIGLLCRAIVHLSEADAGANASFNIANGDVFSWSNLWPRVANAFGLEYGPPQRYSLLEYMADKEPVWQRIVKKHGLRELALKDLVAWNYGDFHFNKEGNDICSLVKLNQAGFHDVTDTEHHFMTVLQRFRDERVLP